MIPKKQKPLNQPQNAKEPPKEASMRELQSNMPKRVNEGGKPTTPRLAEQKRPNADKDSGIKGIVRKQARSAALKWAIGIIGGSTAVATGVTWSILN